MHPQCDILLIEDNPTDVELTVEAFRRNHIQHRVHVCRDADEALDFLNRRGVYGQTAAPRPDLVLLDLNLPRRSGAEVLREIKNSFDLRSIPVVVLTTSEREEDIRSCYHLGANSYLTKPVQFERFVELIRMVQTYWLSTGRLPPKP